MSANEDLMEKYERVLSRLRLDADDLTFGDPIALHVADPVAETCSVTLRLVHSSGRTYAQRDVELGPMVTAIPLAKALNMPVGDYDIVLTPPLEEYFSTLRYERRLPLRIGLHAVTKPQSGEAAGQSSNEA